MAGLMRFWWTSWGICSWTGAEPSCCSKCSPNGKSARPSPLPPTSHSLKRTCSRESVHDAAEISLVRQLVNKLLGTARPLPETPTGRRRSQGIHGASARESDGPHSWAIHDRLPPASQTRTPEALTVAGEIGIYRIHCRLQLRQ